jgi:hypothetical protein
MEIKRVISKTEGMRTLGGFGINERMILKWRVGNADWI